MSVFINGSASLSPTQMTALSVGYIQTYRDSVDSLGESVDMSIKVTPWISVSPYVCYFDRDSSSGGVGGSSGKCCNI